KEIFRSAMTPAQSELATWFHHLIRLWREQFRSQEKQPPLTLSEIRRLSRGIQKLSHGLTRERILSGRDYFKDPDLLGAYLLFYWPVSYVQARYILKAHSIRPESVLELGSGAGPIGAACDDICGTKITFADRNPMILKLALELGRQKKLKCRTITWNPRKPLPDMLPKYDLITFQHVLNELWQDDPDRIQKRLNLVKSMLPRLTHDGRLLFIEPASMSPSRDLLLLRNRMLSEGLYIEAPCLFKGACPALEKESDTCHMDLRWSPPPFLKTGIKQAGFQKKELKMTYFIFRTQPVTTPKDPQLFRIVSDKMLSKNGKIRFIGCHKDGRISLSLHPSETSPGNRDFSNLKRGDLVRITDPEQTENGYKLHGDSKVDVIYSTRYQIK
ncbi:MAG: methyltransferase type 12, partial [Deltaproteobacteria bacterium]|nr:methyltransferase type 12 [Deltaproteobacteria bacterium]